ncbi:TetR/AcrR family transcriptional regulator [Noviherbaspirillum sp.]|uniref:TetR/AcrR family transcriptional regulator n=1 Tax=Noviherbaspirillum sp. TaxID=1926288 RepID=UPI002B480807|nr:TetR/AcrR family transcriptional regulator [Noviherbaspirillum sp.]HJV79836.1 TetR/AcrR family transcriptional regulator [Noviherbaspirillum sp.]
MSPTLKTSLKRKTSNTTEKGYERAHDILRAAREIFAAEGYGGLSMRRVAAQVGASLSNVQHYYGSKDTLIEALLLDAMNQLQDKIDSIVASMEGKSRVEQFLATIDMFLEELGSPVMRGMFFEFWALATRNTFASALMEKMQARERKAIFKLIQGMSPHISDEDYIVRAALIVAQVEGLMLFRVRNRPRRPELEGLENAAREAVLRLATQP